MVNLHRFDKVPSHMRHSRIPALLCLAALIAGCSGTETVEDRPRNAATLYEDAQQAQARGDYQRSIELLERLEARYPFSREAQQGQVEIIYVYYRSLAYDQAQAASDRLLREQPRHPDIDYVHYLRGLLNFDRGLNVIDGLFRVDPAKRDQTLTRQSFQSFATLVNNYPDSRYVPDARQRMIHLRNQLARHEIHVAAHYMELGAFTAAANRARTVIEEFQETPSIVDGLVILHNAYAMLELDELADDVAQVVALNHPDARRRLYR